MLGSMGAPRRIYRELGVPLRACFETQAPSDEITFVNPLEEQDNAPNRSL